MKVHPIRKRVYRVAIDYTNMLSLNGFQMTSAPSFSLRVIMWRKSETWQYDYKVYNPTPTALHRLIRLIIGKATWIMT